LSRTFRGKNYRKLSITAPSARGQATPASPFGTFDIKTPKRISKASLPTLPSAPCTVTDFIWHQVESQPSAFAVHCEHERPLTYAELWQLAVDIAARAGLGAGLIVPICMNPSNEFVATILAVLLSGSAYTVLDPEGAPERNRAIVADTGAATVLVHEQHADLFEAACPVERLLHRRQSVSRASLERRGSAVSFPGVSPGDLLYMVYTSGECPEAQPFFIPTLFLFFSLLSPFLIESSH
jgi:non-ribosomal peptide synthetase component F